jgi:hypothetical protein
VDHELKRANNSERVNAIIQKLIKDLSKTVGHCTGILE